MADECSARPLRGSSHLVNPAVCFFLNAISYMPLSPFAALCLMNEKSPFSPKSRPLDDLMEGVRYATGFAPIWSPSPAVALVSLAECLTPCSCRFLPRKFCMGSAHPRTPHGCARHWRPRRDCLSGLTQEYSTARDRVLPEEQSFLEADSSRLDLPEITSVASLRSALLVWE